LEYLKGKYHLEVLCIDGKIIKDIKVKLKEIRYEGVNWIRLRIELSGELL
jgi:hypothetical protein